MAKEEEKEVTSDDSWDDFDYYFDDTAICGFCGYSYCTCCGCSCMDDDIYNDFVDDEEPAESN